MADQAPAVGSVDWALSIKRGKAGLRHFFVEGTRFCEEAASSALPVVAAFVTAEAADAHSALSARLAARGARVRIVPDRVLRRLAFTTTPAGIVLIVQRPQARVEEVLRSCTRVVYLDGVQDPGNVGAILRAARAFSWDAAIVGAGTADPFSPKAARASASAELTLPVLYDPDQAMARALNAAGFALLGADSHATTDLTDVELPARAVLVLGSEGAGLTPPLRSLLSRTFRITLVSGSESLNVAQAAAIVMYALRPPAPPRPQKPSASPE